MGIDLNLLRSLDVLLGELNVTRAAQKLGISQPALSAQLTRLRALLDDPLLVAADSGRGMVATRRALELQSGLRATLRQLEDLVRERRGFDPRTAQRTFIIAASDNSVVLIGRVAVDAIAKQAGAGVRIAFRQTDPAFVPDLLERGDVDFFVGGEKLLAPPMKSVKLTHEDMVLVQRRHHPRGTKRLDLDGYCRLRHILVSPSGGSFHGPVDDTLAKLGRKRHVCLSVQQFLLAAALVKDSDCVCIFPRRLAASMRDTLDTVELPVATSGFQLHLGWHPRADKDPGAVWLKRILRSATR
jgi:DNA-binding transcriptional LysR family regulator